MKKISIILIFVILIGSLANAGQIKRIEVTPVSMVNLSQGHAGAFMGGALTGDFFLTDQFALRTTIGYTKDRYFPEEIDYTEADYTFWLQFAPYYEIFLSDSWKPYLLLIGTFNLGGGRNISSLQPVGMNQAPYNQLRPEATNEYLYSFGGSLGSKFKLFGPVSLFAEATYYFYTHFSDRGGLYNSGYIYQDQSYNRQENPAYLSLGLSYTFDLGN